MAEKKTPMRQCLGCREMKPKFELFRVVRMTDGNVQLDLKGKLPGRGAYLCSIQCMEKAIKARSLERMLGVSVPKSIYESLQTELEENF
jgi:predicted RNA-binding protein YlxR (DUF448 family)